MRTVHETEALRPSDPVPKSMQTSGAGGKKNFKIIIRTPQSHAAGQSDLVDDGHSADEQEGEPFTQLTEKDGFTERELAMPFQTLHTLCRHQVRWALEDGETLKQECKKWEDIYKQAWLEKEVLVTQMVKSELDWSKRRSAVLSAATEPVLSSAETAEARLATSTEKLSPVAR